MKNECCSQQSILWNKKNECCSHQLIRRKRKIENWTLQSSTASSRTKKWKMNVAVSNQFFETRKTNVAWFIGNKWSKIERCSHQLIFFWAKNLKLNLAINNHLKPDCMCMQLSIGFWKWEIEYTYITNYCRLSADIELALNVTTYAGKGHHN